MEKMDLLNKGLQAEFRAITFYLENLKKLNYAKNRTAVDVLILESLEHATELTKELLVLRREEGGVLSHSVQREAMVEEISMTEIYKYELERTSDPELRKLMEYLIKEEERHQKLVDSLR